MDKQLLILSLDLILRILQVLINSTVPLVRRERVKGVRIVVSEENQNPQTLGVGLKDRLQTLLKLGVGPTTVVWVSAPAIPAVTVI